MSTTNGTIAGTPNPAHPAGPVLGSEIDEITPIGLTPAQTSQWQDTMSLMAWTCPGFRHLFYKLLANNDGKYGAVPTQSVPVAATDQKNIMINPDTFFGYSLKERVFIMGHEVVHNVYNDVEWLNRCLRSGVVPMDDGTTIPFREGTMQKAMDFRINALLRDSKIGSPPKDCLLDDTIATANEGVCDVYRKVWDDEENNGGKKVGGKSFDVILKPGASTGSPSPRNNQQWAVEIAAASVLETMKSQGKGHGALNRFFDLALNPVVPWTDHIRGIFNRKVGTGSYDWKKPDRRMIMRDIYMPSRSGSGAGWIVCWGDTSGSIGTDEMTRYMNELGAIIDDCSPTRITVLWCDDEIHRVDEIEEAIDLETIKAEGTSGGGGGTSVHPVMEWIEENGMGERPEVFIGFTDGYVSFPAVQPDIPVVIWAMTTEVDAPWGEMVRINPK